jgi:HSP20 family protein
MATLPARRRGQTPTLLDPTREFEDIYDRMGQLMNFAFSGLAPFGGLGTIADVPWAPPADVTETDDAYMIHVELPGVRRDEINVEMRDREVIISGEVREEGDGGQRRRSSRRAGRFEYRAYLPGDINPEGVRAELADGVLTVMVPKSEAAKPRRIEVAEGESGAGQVTAGRGTAGGATAGQAGEATTGGATRR